MHFVWITALMTLVFTACAGTTEPEPAPPPAPAPIARPAPPPPPPPEPEPVRSYQPIELPKTASQRPALALSGLMALAGAGALHWLRRRG